MSDFSNITEIEFVIVKKSKNLLKKSKMRNNYTKNQRCINFN